MNYPPIHITYTLGFSLLQKAELFQKPDRKGSQRGKKLKNDQILTVNKKGAI